MGGYLIRLGPVFNLNDEQGLEWETADVPSHRPPVCLVKSSQTHLRYSRLTLFTPLDRHSFLFLGLSPTLFFKVILCLFPYIVVTTCILLRQAPLFGLSLAPTTLSILYLQHCLSVLFSIYNFMTHGFTHCPARRCASSSKVPCECVKLAMD